MSVVRLLKLGWSLTEPVLEIDVKCPSCGFTKTYTPTLNDLKSVCNDYTVHTNEDNNIVWIEGNTRLLKCPMCGYKTAFKIAIHRNGTVMIFEEGEQLEEEWWRFVNEL